ncbi:hypothetical protein QR680_018094 [Steinernema hermaphroditum]|uniref:Aminopeptidase n=1 Tax=Steinernema hermaphroditum TaxID=289476 RepID=A0AA39HGW7_9BILA|nr:hypothetical protein QR680_018094 [Steinernema hermaphroditum]
MLYKAAGLLRGLTGHFALQTARMSTAADKFQRLPELAKPSLYNIILKPDLQKFTFDGEETIDLEITKPTDFLKLHASEMSLSNASIKLASGEAFENLPIEYDKKWATVTVKLPKAVDQVKATLSLKFVGELNDKMHGFYRSSYKDASGVEKFMASTQFESTYARLCFPCWDEPMYKAKFNISLEVDQHLTALSNMNVIEEKPVEGAQRKLVKYATTPIMSTYLLAFAVGELEYIEDKTKSGCVMRVYTVPGKKELGKFGLDLATKAIDWYNDWFGLVYPLPKCDLIAIPDFSMGAMENWGLVTYREVALLVDPAKSSTRQKSRVALVIAHELAHLWFGDLVTMKWWTDLWLKEGFASFMEYMFVGSNNPEFKIWLHFVNDELAAGLSLDALRSSHPIEVEIDNPNELDEIYDSITYAKSNSINRMLCSYLGEETFRDGLRRYLKKFQYSNATTVDLWKALGEASGQDIEKMMSGWTKQMGFPLITVTQRQEGSKRIVTVSQKRFIADGSQDEAGLLWQVPITISTQSDPEKVKHKFLLTRREEEFHLDDVKDTDYIKLNAGTTGFYRVQYTDDMLKAMMPDISSQKIPVVDRFGITNDLFALVNAGKVSATNFLMLLEASVAENEYVVWGSLDGGVSAIANVLAHHDDQSVRKKFDQFICKTLEPVAKRLGWEAAADEDSQLAMTRALVMGRLAKCGHQETIDTGRKLFEDHVKNKTELHPDLRNVIYGIVGRYNGEEGIDQLKNIFTTCGFSEIERNCILGMGQASDDALLRKVFDYGMEGKIRSQDLMLLFAAARVHKTGQDFVWQYFKNNVKQLQQKFGGANSSLFQHCFKLSADSQCSEKIAVDVESLFKDDEDVSKTLDRPIRQVTESIRLNQQLLQQNCGVVNDWLCSKCQ